MFSGNLLEAPWSVSFTSNRIFPSILKAEYKKGSLWIIFIINIVFTKNSNFLLTSSNAFRNVFQAKEHTNSLLARYYHFSSWKKSALVCLQVGNSKKESAGNIYYETELANEREITWLFVLKSEYKYLSLSIVERYVIYISTMIVSIFFAL